MIEHPSPSLMAHFKATETLHIITPIPAVGIMPAGWKLRMPIGGQHVTVTMYRVEPGVRGAYRVHLSHHLAKDEWELAALEVLGDMVSFFITDRRPLTEAVLEAIAAEFHRVYTMGTVMAEVASLRGAFLTEVDGKLMRWVCLGAKAADTSPRGSQAETPSSRPACPPEP